MRRPEIYYFLIPFTCVSLLLYFRVLRKIFISRKSANYSTFFFRMSVSMAIYDISYVIVYYIMEIPQDLPALHGVLYSLNGTIIPQMHWAHQWQCLLAQFYGVTLISVSRMLSICYPTEKITQYLRELPMKAVLSIHGMPPFLYFMYVMFFQALRRYQYNDDGSISPVRDPKSLEKYRDDPLHSISNDLSLQINSNVVLFTSTSGAIISAVCYIRIFIFLRTRNQSWRNAMSVIVTSFILFISLCLVCVYYLVYLYATRTPNWTLFGFLRRINYVVSFTLCFSNPYSLFICSAEIRRAVLGQWLSRFFTKTHVLHVAAINTATEVVTRLPASKTASTPPNAVPSL